MSKRKTKASPARTDRDTLIAARENASTANEIVAAECRIAWANSHNGEICPAGMILSENDLANWLTECPASVMAEANALLSQVPETVDGEWKVLPFSENPVLIAQHIAPPLGPKALAELAANPRGLADVPPALEARRFPHQVLSLLPQIHARWLAIPKAERPLHPLAPIVRAWQEWKARQPREVAPFIPKRRASLPRLHRIAADSTLPGFPGSDAPAQGDQFALPGLEPAITACPSWLLWLFDTAGGESMAQGRGAPWDLHLFVSSFLHLAHGQRDGHWRTLRFPHLVEHEADWPVSETPSIERWLFADGWTRQNMKRDWHRLPEALNRMKRDLGYVPVDGGRIALVFPSVIPDSMHFPVVEFTVRIPASAASGARVDWNRLRQYRLGSAALYRAYLAAVAFMDRAAHHGHGITAEIAPPVLGPGGKPLRGKGGKIERSLTETIPNRHARFVKSLDDRDLTRMIGLDPDSRDHRYKARRAFERLDADGVIDLRKDRDGWRIFAPGRDQT